MENTKWTVRNVPLETKKKLLEVKQVSGGTFGELLAEAIDYWFEALPEDSALEESAAATLSSQVGQKTTCLDYDSALPSFDKKP